MSLGEGTANYSKKQECRRLGIPDEAEKVLGCSADKSLAAYEERITGMTMALGGSTLEHDITEENWERLWREFWSKTD